MKVYIPSYLGDVTLEAKGGQTILTYNELTALEERGLRSFLKGYKLPGGSGSGLLTIDDSLANAHKKFIKAFKAGKPVLNAIKLHDGKLELVSDFTDTEGVGVTTEKPFRHCPMPVWEQKEMRGIAVLSEFLLSQQLADFLKYRAFVAKGNHTGNPYLLTSRWNPHSETVGVLYSLTEQRSICASLSHIPPSEELLAMKICVECDELNFVFGPA